LLGELHMGPSIPLTGYPSLHDEACVLVLD
jgi:hypothetical protein